VEAALDEERTARACAERSLQEALSVIQSLETKLAHTELAHSEALAIEREKRDETEKALQGAITAHKAAEQRLREMTPAHLVGAPAKKAAHKTSISATSARRADPAPKSREPQPVKWWLPRYKAKANKR
jgi:hypothetical protein